MTERDTDERAPGERTRPCPACGAANRGNDRFCAQCGTALPARAADEEQAIPPQAAPGAVPLSSGADVSTPDDARSPVSNEEQTDQDNAAWLLGARPAAVVAGGLLLLLLAAALLAIGQRDDTGTIVMLSICTAPLGLLTLAIGIARYIASTTKRGA